MPAVLVLGELFVAVVAVLLSPATELVLTGELALALALAFADVLLLGVRVLLDAAAPEPL